VASVADLDSDEDIAAQVAPAAASGPDADGAVVLAAALATAEHAGPCLVARVPTDASAEHPLCNLYLATNFFAVAAQHPKEQVTDPLEEMALDVLVG